MLVYAETPLTQQTDRQDINWSFSTALRHLPKVILPSPSTQVFISFVKSVQFFLGILGDL